MVLAYPHYHLDCRSMSVCDSGLGLFSVTDLTRLKPLPWKSSAPRPGLELILRTVVGRLGTRYVSPLPSGTGLSGLDGSHGVSFLVRRGWGSHTVVERKAQARQGVNTPGGGRRAGKAGGENPTKAAELSVRVAGQREGNSTLCLFSRRFSAALLGRLVQTPPRTEGGCSCL